MNGHLVDETSAPANLVEDALFLLLLALEEKKAVRLQYGLSLVWLTVESGERTVPNEASLVGRCARVAISQVRASDVVSALSSDAIAILLIGAESTEIGEIVRRVTEAIAAHLETPGGRLNWNAGAASYPRHAGTTMELLHRAEVLTLKARAEGRKRLCMPVS